MTHRTESALASAAFVCLVYAVGAAVCWAVGFVWAMFGMLALGAGWVAVWRVVK